MLQQASQTGKLGIRTKTPISFMQFLSSMNAQHLVQLYPLKCSFLF